MLSPNWQRRVAVRSQRAWVLAGMVALGGLLVLQTGCVTRRLTIRSNPPGARVYVGDEELGTTPVAHDFTYYGTRKIRLVKDGYETLIVNQPVPAPWYQLPPLDFVSENLVPGEIRDERNVTYELRPLQLLPRDQLIQKANGLRRASGGQPGMAVPANATTIPPNGFPAGPEVVPPGTAVGPAPGPTTLPPPPNTPQWIYPVQPSAPDRASPGTIQPLTPPVR
ncbi:MAG: PEGA domain-containing protein [Pirellulales bacterium]|nr:PEGA domain-containing protein [Pirellulales bacterium]